MKTTFIRIAPILALAAISPVFAVEPAESHVQTTEKKVVVTPAPASETTTTTTTTTTGAVAVAPQTVTIARMIRDSATFSILSKAIDAAGLNDVLEGKDQNTLFAPTDDAFMKLPKGTLERLMLPENKEKLRSLITYHIIQGEFPSTALREGEVKTMSGDKVKIEVSAKEIKINDAKIVNGDLLATNGVIHVVDKVIMDKKLDLAKIDK